MILVQKTSDINLQVKNNWQELIVLKQKKLKKLNYLKGKKIIWLRKKCSNLEDANLESPDEIMHLKTKESKLSMTLR